jgi:hypothetical protein
MIEIVLTDASFAKFSQYGVLIEFEMTYINSFHEYKGLMELKIELTRCDVAL